MLAFSNDLHPQPGRKTTAPTPGNVTLIAAVVATLLLGSSCQKRRATAENSDAPSREHNAESAAQAADAAHDSAAPEFAAEAVSSAETAEPAAEEVRLPDLPLPPQQRGAPKNDGEIRAVFDDYGFPVGPRLTPLCGRQEFLQGGETQSWDAFESPLPRAELLEFYRSKLGERGLEILPNEAHWSLPPGSPAPTRRLTLSDPGRAGPHLACKPGPQATTKTILVMLRQ